MFSSLLHSVKKSFFVVIVVGLVMAMFGCAIERADFNAFLDRAIGNPLSTTDYDFRLDRTGGKSLVTQGDSVQTYRYQLPKSDCAWEVDIQKQTTIVLRWRYVSDVARNACNNLPARRGV